MASRHSSSVVFAAQSREQFVGALRQDLRRGDEEDEKRDADGLGDPHPRGHALAFIAPPRFRSFRFPGQRAAPQRVAAARADLAILRSCRSLDSRRTGLALPEARGMGFMMNSSRRALCSHIETGPSSVMTIKEHF